MTHKCDLMESWCMDARLPVELRNGEYVLILNPSTVVAMDFCAWCGESLSTKTGAPSRTEDCEHIRMLSSLPESSIQYKSGEKIYSLAGKNDLSVCLFFCPICGYRLPTNQASFVEPSPGEISRLKELFANVKSVDDALSRFGEPDHARGPNLDHVYTRGQKVILGYKRVLFYERLALTADVQVVEWLDGHTDVKFVPKPQLYDTKATGE